MKLLMLALFDDRIDDVAKHQRYLAVGLDIDREGVHYSTLPDTLRRNLHHIILKDIQSRGLRVEDYDILLRRLRYPLADKSQQNVATSSCRR